MQPKGSFMTSSTAPKKDETPIVLPAAADAAADKKDEANKTPSSSDKK